MDLQDCPHCGSPVMPRSICCKACGSDFETGWQDPGEIEYSSIELPESSSYSDSVQTRRSEHLKRTGLLTLGLLCLGVVGTIYLPTREMILAWLALGLLLRMIQEKD